MFFSSKSFKRKNKIFYKCYIYKCSKRNKKMGPQKHYISKKNNKRIFKKKPNYIIWIEKTRNI